MTSRRPIAPCSRGLELSLPAACAPAMTGLLPCWTPVASLRRIGLRRRAAFRPLLRVIDCDLGFCKRGRVGKIHRAGQHRASGQNHSALQPSASTRGHRRVTTRIRSRGRQRWPDVRDRRVSDAVETATIAGGDAWSADAILDATVPTWRLRAAGADAIRAEYGALVRRQAGSRTCDGIRTGRRRGRRVHAAVDGERRAARRAPHALLTVRADQIACRRSRSAAAAGRRRCWPRWRPPVTSGQLDLAELLAAATAREPLADAPEQVGRAAGTGRDRRPPVRAEAPGPGRRLDPMRAAGQPRGVRLERWERGILRRLPAWINQPIVAVAYAPPSAAAGRPARAGAVLMHDVARLAGAGHGRAGPGGAARREFLRHMAALHAAYGAAGSEYEVVPAMHRYLELSPWLAEAEASVRSEHLVPQLVGKGWQLLPQVAPAAAGDGGAPRARPRPAGDVRWPRPRRPSCTATGSWTTSAPTTPGRTVLLDWEQPGRGAALSDLAWYLAINCRRAAAGQGRRDQQRTGARWKAAASTPHHGGTGSWSTVPARRARAVRLGEGARRLRRGAAHGGRTRAIAGPAAAGLVTVRPGLPTSSAAGGWDEGPGRMYADLAAALVGGGPDR